MQDKLKAILKKFSFGNAEPDKDWKKIFSFFALLAVIALVWNIYFYLDVQGEIEAAEAAQPVISATGHESEDKLKSTIKAYEARAAENASVVSGASLALPASVLEDPSRP